MEAEFFDKAPGKAEWEGGGGENLSRIELDVTEIKSSAAKVEAEAIEIEGRKVA